MAAVDDNPGINGFTLTLYAPLAFPTTAGEGDFLYVDGNVGLLIPLQEIDWLQVDGNVGLAIPPQPGDYLYVDGDLVYGTGRVQYPWLELVDGSTSPNGRY